MVPWPPTATGACDSVVVHSGIARVVQSMLVAWGTGLEPIGSSPGSLGYWGVESD